ncbi:hypothetical protein ZOSMA_214G00060 [Zostera marina]|uniref:Pentatricopeptide repeat-containing protein n=1 Tax=Zostera marina TaxID=29655 RepID=A0A0K9PK31_ZOSMR|nr:hypothetical protein ZOSMA_214G00060 [Zostera marina]
MALVSFSPPFHLSNISFLARSPTPSAAGFCTIPRGTNSNSSSLSITTAFDYNALIKTHTNSSLHITAVALFLQMLHSDIPPNHYTFPFLLKSVSALGSLRLGHQIHTHILKFGCFPDNIYSSTAVLDFYAKWGALGDARKLFDRIPDRNTAVWNSMITCYVQHGLLDETLDMFTAMEVDVGEEVGVSSWNSAIAGCVRRDDVNGAFDVVRIMMTRDMKPSPATFNTLLPVIPDMGHRIKELHGYVTRHLDVIDISSVDEDRLRSAIATSYAKTQYMDHACRLFQSTTVRNNQLYVALISGFLITRNIRAAFEIFREAAARSSNDSKVMSKIMLTVILPRCDDDSGTRLFKHGLEIHAYAYRHHLESHTSVSNALIAMYARKRGQGGKNAAAKAERVFEMTVNRDVITWNTIVSTNVCYGDFDRALSLFRQMISEEVRPDVYSFGSVLNACGHSSSLLQGMSLHCRIIKTGLFSSEPGCPVVDNAVVDMYAKCGSTECARKAFDEIEEKDIISWNTVISMYAYNACPDKAFSLFSQMKDQGFTPDRITFIGILTACSHSGSVNEALEYFKNMELKYRIVPDVNHYTCIVDGLCRAGKLREAYKTICTMPIEPDDCTWGVLLNGCRIHGNNIELAEIVAKRLNTKHSGYQVLLSNIYADGSKWNKKVRVRESMKEYGVKKSPGRSWIELVTGIWSFFSGRDYDELDVVSTVDSLTKQLLDEGYFLSTK